MSTAAPGQLKLAITSQKPAATTAGYGIVATDYFGATVDQSGITLTPTTSVTNNGDTTYTITRPTNLAGDATYIVTASAPNYASVTAKIIVPAQAAVILAAPALSVTPTQSATQVSYAYTATGTLTWLKDAVNQGAPGGTPLVVARDAPAGTDHQVQFHCVGANGSILDLYFTLPVQPTASGGAASSTAATQTTPWGYSTAAQADGIVTLLNKLRDGCLAKGIVT